MKLNKFLNSTGRGTCSDLITKELYKTNKVGNIVLLNENIKSQIDLIVLKLDENRTNNLLKLLDDNLKEQPDAFKLLELDDKKVIKKFSKTEFSNMYPVDVFFNGRVWPSNEHAYMHEKFDFEFLKTYFRGNKEIFEDVKETIKDKFEKKTEYGLDRFDEIFCIEKLEELYFDKKIGGGFLKTLSGEFEKLDLRVINWEEKKLSILVGLNIEKYTNHKYFKEKLLATKSKRLVEGNDWGDVFWGVDINEKKGFNYLGRTLELIRDNYL